MMNDAVSKKPTAAATIESDRISDSRRWMPWLVLLGYLPLIYWHVAGLLQRPHYQFLYLLPVMLWILVSSRPESEVDADRTSWWTGAAAVACGLCLLAYAAWVWSPWIAAVSFLLSALGLLLMQFGWDCGGWFRTWAFLCILIPLPFGMDEDLIVYLRGVTTRLSSSVLDQIGLLHNSYANVVELPGKPLFIADACSGIHSLYVLMAGALFVAMWLQRGFIHTIALLVSTFALVLVENVTRIVMVAVLWNRGSDFTAGFNHEMLGVVLFCLSLLFLFSIDQMLLFFLPSRVPNLFVWLWKKSMGADEDGRMPKPVPVAVHLRKAAFVASLVFPVIGVAQVFLMPSTPPSPVVDLFDDFELPELGAEALPENLGEFERRDFHTVKRVPGDPLGQASQLWEYTHGGATVTISIDYPYTGVHDLCVCYGATGWSIPDKEVIPAEQLQSRYPQLADGPVAIGNLDRDLYGHALLIFNLDDAEGQAHALIKSIARGDAGDRAAARFGSFGRDGEASQFERRGPGPFVQYQLFARLPAEADDQMRDRLLEIFLQAKQILRPQVAGQEVK